MNIIIYFLLPDFKVVMVYLSYCFNSIGSEMLFDFSCSWFLKKGI